MQTQRRRVVGTFTVTEPTVYSNYFECAAWHERVAVEPGEYPVYEYQDAPHGCVNVSLPGVVESDYFQSLWCGSRIGEAYDTTKNAGKPAAARLQFYRWNERIMLAEEPGPWEVCQ